MIQKLANQAIKHLKENYILPNSGILAGGSLANLIWEYKSGNKAIINDIDVFVYNEKIELEDTYQKGGIYDKRKDLVIENITSPYDDMVKKGKDSFYQIVSTDQDKMINYITYNSNKETVSNIINGFDFNCTQIGYDLKTNEFLWTKDFEEFINTGKLLCTNLQYPIHSMLRMPKKCEELNLELPKSEMELLRYAICCQLPDMNKRYFSDKYLKNYIKYQDILCKYANVRQEPHIQEFFLNTKKISMNIYSLVPLERVAITGNNYFNNYHDLLFYWRYIKDYPNRDIYWRFHRISDYNIDYFDGDLDFFDMELLNDYYMFDHHKTLTGKTLTEQVTFLKKLESKFGRDKTKTILENVSARNINPDDEDDLTIVELCCRKANYHAKKINYDFDLF